MVDYPNLWAYVRDIYHIDAIKRTVNMEHARRHYYESHHTINPAGVVTVAPELDWEAKPMRMTG